MPKAKLSGNGITDYLQTIKKLEGDVEEVAKKAVYEGTKVVADQVRANIQALPIDEHWGTPEHPRHGVTQYQKRGLLEGFGVASMQNDRGFLNTMVGFDSAGYNEKGQPNLMVARATQSGTSFSDKLPFFDEAVRATKTAAKNKMIEVSEDELKKITKG